MLLNFSPTLSFFVIERCKVGKYFYSVGINSSGLHNCTKESRQLFLNKAKLKN